MGEFINDKSIILTTTNGTRIFGIGDFALCSVVGAFVNNEAVVEYLATKRDILDESV